MNETDLPIPDRAIVLVGPMGAGKSTVGRRLAARLGLPFADADAEIEAAAGRPIAEIFERCGEAAFREDERRVVARLLRGDPKVLATGGGAFMDPETRRRIEAAAVSVWLRADLDVLTARATRRGDRPLLRNGDPRATMARLLAERDPVYARADIAVDTGAGSREAAVERVVAALRERFARR